LLLFFFAKAQRHVSEDIVPACDMRLGPAKRFEMKRIVVVAVLVAGIVLSALLGPGSGQVRGCHAPTVATVGVDSIGADTATLHGNLIDWGVLGWRVCYVAFEWGTTTNYGEATPAQPMQANGPFTAVLSGLMPGTEYHFRARAWSAYGQDYGVDMCFTTLGFSGDPPTVTTDSATCPDPHSATLNGTLVDMGSATTVDASFEWGVVMGPDSRTYTVDADFDEGVMENVDHDAPYNDQLQITEQASYSFPIMWIANAGEDSLSKWNTETNTEVARYHTWFGPLANHDAWTGPAPSRTCVDAEGNAYVANRHFDGRVSDVIKIYSTDWVDRNGNGVMDTSWDGNGDGTISSLEMLPMSDSNGNGVIDDSEIRDERIAWAVTVGPPDGRGRGLAVGTDGTVWVGLFNAQQYYQLSSVDGSVLAGPIDVGPHTPYGALVDRHGVLWGTSAAHCSLLRLDTNTHNVTIYDHSVYGYNYGIALGYDSADNTVVYLGSPSGGHTYIKFDSVTGTFSIPAAEPHYKSLGIATDANGDIVVGNAADGTDIGGVTKYSAVDGSVIWSAEAQVAAEPRGTIIDSEENVWLIHRPTSQLSKFDGSTGAPLGVFDSGLYPYTYTDAAGHSLANATDPWGTWTVDCDSGHNDTVWGILSWNCDEPAGTSLSVRVWSSDDLLTFSGPEDATNGVLLASISQGRYLRIEARFEGLRNNGSLVAPVLYDLTVQYSPGGSYVSPSTYEFDTTLQAMGGTGAFSHDVALNPLTLYHFRAKASGDGLSYGQDMQFRYTDGGYVNSPPYFTSTPRTSTIVGTLYIYAATAIDPELGEVVYSLDQSSAGMIIDSSTGVVQWTPTPAQIGYHVVAVRATDPQGLPQTQNFTVYVAGDGDHDGGGCFIATAAYGTPLAGELDILRDFRDEYLLTNPAGEALVEIYYSVSPPIADFIAERDGLRAVVRAGLVPVVAMTEMTLSAKHMVVLPSAALVCLMLALWARQRRQQSI
jgi:hypothetical protein